MISKQDRPGGKNTYPDIFFTDINVQNKVRYSYRITCVDFFGRESQPSEKLTVMPGDKTSPLQPYSVNRKVDKYNIRISWRNRHSSDQEGIAIYRSYQHDDQYVKINSQLLPITDTVYIDKDLKAGYYYYIIAAVDSAGNEGKSAKMLAEVHDITPPAMPMHVIAKADTGRIRLQWDANTEADLLGYQVYRTVDKDLKDYYVLLNAVPLTYPLFFDTLPRNARNKFLYKITAVDSSLNRSEYTQAVKAHMPDVTPPVQPVIIGANAKGDYLMIDWIPNKEPDLAGYKLFRSINNGQEKTMINSGLLSSSVTRFTDISVLPDSLYSYTLVASDSTGNNSISSLPFTGRLINQNTKENESELMKFTISQPLFSKYWKLQWKARTSDTFIGYALYYRYSNNDEPQRLCNLTQENNYTDHIRHKQKAEYQLRLYHKSGQVIKSQWIQKL